MSAAVPSSKLSMMAAWKLCEIYAMNMNLFIIHINVGSRRTCTSVIWPGSSFIIHSLNFAGHRQDHLVYQADCVLKTSLVCFIVLKEILNIINDYYFNYFLHENLMAVTPGPQLYIRANCEVNNIRLE